MTILICFIIVLIRLFYKFSWLNILLLLIVVNLAGCSTNKELKTDKIIDLPKIQCDDLTDFKGKTLADLYVSYIELAKMYQKCANLNNNKGS